jgi:hypothetical protein
MSRSQSLGEASLDSLQHSSEVRDSINNDGRTHPVIMSESNSPPIVIDSGRNRNDQYLSHLNMQHPMEFTSDHAAVGETETFRARAMARRFVNTSRRKLLEKNASVKSMASTSTNVGVGEATPLVASIPEDRSTSKLDLGMGSNQPKETAEDEKENEEVPINIWRNFFEVWFGKYVSVFLLATPLALWATFHGWSGAWIFWTNFFVLLPLASILGDFTEVRLVTMLTFDICCNTKDYFLL